jgi:hypothetical protein
VPAKFETMRPQKMVGTMSLKAGRLGCRRPRSTVRSARSCCLPCSSLIAGSVDVISFLGLGGLFTAHMAILAAHVVSGGAAQLALMLSVPIFMVVFGRKEILRT